MLALELLTAYADRRIVLVPPSARDPAFDVVAAYAVEAEIAALRRAGGHPSVGRKVGYANRALWRVHKLESVLWAHMYDDTVRYAEQNTAELGVGRMYAPKLEPEIIFRLKRALRGDPADPLEALRAVEWLALGFEIVDCRYPNWKFQPADFVAGLGLHAGLIVGEALRVEPGMLPRLAEQLAGFKVRLLKDGELVAQGSGANVLKSPALCLGELASGIARQAQAEPLAAGELIATGALTENQFIGPRESWAVQVEGLELPPLTLGTTA